MTNIYEGRVARGGVLSDSATATAAIAGKLGTTAQAADTVKVAGATVSGTAAAGKVLTATGATTAVWTSDVGSLTAVKTSAYTAAVGELVLANSGTTWVLTTPAATAGAWFRVKKVTGDTNAVTVTPASGQVDGASTLAVSAAYASKTVFCDGTNWWSLD